MYVERLLPVLLQSGLGSLSMDGAMDEVVRFSLLSYFPFQFMLISIESRYCTRIFLVYGQSKNFKFIVIIDSLF